ncbi:hypothetical protein F4677DRAFT_458494 [Hypoxylon crocopeplum]|nr:hypothetical protein F4677DRAFT_458494 [Hypoxylon crocopeplum]
MRNEPKHDHHRDWKPDMPLISVPTEPIRTGWIRPGEHPPSATTVSVPGTTDFVLGVDTCGFTTSSTITCEFGSACTNVGDYRGCCLPGAEDCTSTIYTACIDYGQAPYAGACGPHTLCCSETNPYCFTYGFTTDGEPGATFTHVECDPTPGFGEMFPYPPEMVTMTPEASATDTSSSPDSSTSDSFTVESNTHSRSSTPTGAIVGAVVGGVALIILVITAAFLIIRRRRRKTPAHDDTSSPPAPTRIAHSSSDTSPVTEKEQAQAVATAAMTSRRSMRRSLLRPLSMIREQTIPIPGIAITSIASPAHKRHRSATVGSTARQSYGPNWPFGATNSNPLASHPVDPDLRKRLSDSRLGASIPHGSLAAVGKEQPRVPILPPPPPPGTKLAKRPPPLLPKSMRNPDSPVRTPSSATAMLQSPRLSYVPVSPIEGVAFSDGAQKRVSRLIGKLNRDDAPSSISTPATTTASPQNAEVVEPVSPIESDGDDVEGYAQRLSYISAPSMPGERDLEAEGLVSPVSPDDVVSDSDDDGDGSVTVSPLESRRGSAAT